MIRPVSAPVGRRAPATLLAVLLAALVALPPAARAASVAPRIADRLSFLHVGPTAGPGAMPQVVDDQGRSVLLRGVNVNGLEDYYQNSATPVARDYPSDPGAYTAGRCPARNPAVESVAVCEFDAAQLRSFGYDVVRLAVSWSLIEPRPGQIDQTELDRIAQVVGWLKAQGIYSVIDLHQDAWSKYLYTSSPQSCPPPSTAVAGPHESDGAPAWASDHVAPVCYLNAREVDPAVQEDFQRLWSDVPGPDGIGLQEHFANVELALARRFAGEPGVAGYEILNEPSPGYIPPGSMDASELFPFYSKVISTVRAALPGFHQLFFIEPNAVRNVTDQRDAAGPWSAFSPYPNVVYAPHIYTHVFTPDGLLNAPALAPGFPVSGGYDNAASDARGLGLPLWDGEFGANVADDQTTLNEHYQSQDRLGVGGALWVWKADGNAQTGFSDLHGPFGPGVPFPSRIRITDRAYPIYLAGTLASLSYDPNTAGVDLHADSPRVATGDRLRATLVYVPAASTGSLTATGARLEAVTMADGARELYLYPNGGPYHLGQGPAAPTRAVPLCAGRRLAVRVHPPRGGRLLAVRATVARAVVGQLSGRAARRGLLRLDLRGPSLAGRVPVRIVETVKVGRRVRRVSRLRSYVRCPSVNRRPRRRHHRPNHPPARRR